MSSLDAVNLPSLPPGNSSGGFAELAGVCLVEEVYRNAPPETTDPASAARHSHTTRTAAVTAAYHQSLASSASPLFLGWFRPRTGAPISILSSTSPASEIGPSALAFPPGTRGRALPAQRVTALLESMPVWMPIGGATDALVPLTQQAATPAGIPTRLEDGLLSVWHGPFAWILIAEPIPAGDIDEQASALAQGARSARARSDSPDYIVRAERLTTRHQQMRAGSTTGMWRLRLLAGGADPAAAAAVAGLVTAGTDPHGMPYSLCPLGPATGLADALGASRTGPGEHGYPFPAGSAFLAACAHVPASEIPGVRLIERPTFDVVAEHIDTRDAVDLGQVLDHNGLPAGALQVSHATLNRHTFVCGATGSGKSQTVRTLLEALSTGSRPIPWLVIEPAKAEYVRMAGRLPGQVLAIRPGDPDSIPGSINPLEPEPGFPLQTHIDLVRALFEAAFEATEPFPQVLSHAMDRAYRELGWDVALGEPVNPAITPRYPTLTDLRRIALNVVTDIGYGKEVADNVRGFIDVRLGSLTLGTPGRFFEGGHPLDLPDLLARNTVLELEDIGNDQDKAFLIGAVVIRIAEHLRQRARTSGQIRLEHITVIEEAHRLLKRVEPGSPAAHAVELFAGLLSEIRAYGEGIVVAEQIPEKIIPDVVKNSALKIVHRLPAHDDRHSVGATMNLTEQQSRHVVTMPPGHATVFADGMDHPLLAVIHHGGDRENETGIERTPKTTRSRSNACATECRTRNRCTLREIAYAARIATQPPIVLWIELLTVAHIVGEPAPTPDPAWLKALRSEYGDRLLECALGHAVHTSVDTRYLGILPSYRPEELETHLAEHLAHQLRSEPTRCDGRETQWQAGQFRWIDVRRALHHSAESQTPHPDTGTWRERGLDLPGATCAEQLTHFRAKPENRTSQPLAVYGASTPPLYETAAAALDGHAEPFDRLTHASAHLTIVGDWLTMRLYPSAWKKQGGRR